MVKISFKTAFDISKFNKRSNFNKFEINTLFLNKCNFSAIFTLQFFLNRFNWNIISYLTLFTFFSVVILYVFHPIALYKNFLTIKKLEKILLKLILFLEKQTNKQSGTTLFTHF